VNALITIIGVVYLKMSIVVAMGRV